MNLERFGMFTLETQTPLRKIIEYTNSYEYKSMFAYENKLILRNNKVYGNTVETKFHKFIVPTKF